MTARKHWTIMDLNEESENKKPLAVFLNLRKTAALWILFP